MRMPRDGIRTQSKAGEVKIMEQVGKIRKWLGARGFDGVVLGRRDNYTWVSGGAKNEVTSNTETGVSHS